MEQRPGPTLNMVEVSEQCIEELEARERQLQELDSGQHNMPTEIGSDPVLQVHELADGYRGAELYG